MAIRSRCATARPATSTSAIPASRAATCAFGIYADDSWAMTDRITLNAGVRFDLNTGDIPEMPILDAARNEVGTAEAIEDLVDWKTISPRLGVNIKLREAGTVMRASYGRYYQGSTTNLFSALSPAQAVTRRSVGTRRRSIRHPAANRPARYYVVDPTEGALHRPARSAWTTS